MRSTPFILVLAACLMCNAIPAVAQVPRLLSIPVYLEESGIPVNGVRTLDVRWYAAAVGGASLLQETLTTQLDQGAGVLVLGATTPITDTLLMSGPLWLGISIDGSSEVQPRTMLASVPYALMADRARIAEELAPEVTGIVTSLNEIAGAVRLIGGMGVTIRRDGNTLVAEGQRVVEGGTIVPSSSQHVYTITPLNILAPDLTILVNVESDTHIDADVRSVDLVANTFTVVTSAPLLDTERLRWQLIR